ncbi:hypothetical protein Niako_3315 [Niastella koreensis GR20-10]|uniref:Uncharacterized protein n=1 Tax=Niastella koreensis (strain DSM 17620 / KACC 11465 / NBRC 106392 / GR20-10) TaxID=700598 RepID=G8TI28_NIAKG|nr:hypothetical protein Niako_3315 [Niastella koreensis GR20-10]
MASMVCFLFKLPACLYEVVYKLDRRIKKVLINYINFTFLFCP